MSRCKHCKKPIQWLEVPQEGASGTYLQWRVYDKRKRAGEPLNPHICKKEDLPKPDPKYSRIVKDPWWMD